jgi:methylmalonyl-CoA mutase
MNDLFTSFAASSKEEWIAILQKELKGESIDKLQKVNKVEEIAFPSYFHKTDSASNQSDPGQLPYTRGIQSSSNDWSIATPFWIDDEVTTNKQLLNALMSGSTALVIHAKNEATIDFNQLLSEVGMEYIHTTFYAKNIQQVTDFLKYANNKPVSIVCEDSEGLISIALKLKPSNTKLFVIDASKVQTAGSTTWQELAIALAEGHEMLVRLMDNGLTIDDAAALIQFNFGIGNKYFFEVCKFKAFRMTWSKIIETYAPQHACSHAATISAQTTFINTSLKDPYTNLLRQTTEAMSAVVGGINSLCVYPYDWYATIQNLGFTNRMATNISLLLKEEAYLNIVIDPSGGSYALDNLVETIAERAWSSFQWIERNGGINSIPVCEQLKTEIAEKATMRIQAVADKSEKLIGINVFPNPEIIQNEWQTLPLSWKGLPSLVIEQTV